jgi:hypothetical protein
MADLMSLQTLAVWMQTTEAELEADPFYAQVISDVSGLICFIGGHPDWTYEAGEDQAPYDVRNVALNVIKRSAENPGRVIAEGGIGPIGGDRVAEEQAYFTDLTPTERATVAKYNPEGDPDATAGEIFTMSIARKEPAKATNALYVGDNMQTNLETSADPREWMIPMFNPDDPGGEG